MSKLLYVNHRFKELGESETPILQAICDALVPDNVTRSPHHHIRVNGRSAYAVTPTAANLGESGMSVRLGSLFGTHGKTWSVPRSPSPDGSFAIIRADDEHLELVSDATASRTLWYYHDKEIFLASTSQIALVMYLGRFDFDAQVIPWMLSTGTLGPNASWDAKLQRVPADSTLLLEKHRWTLSMQRNTFTLAVERAPEVDHRARLSEAIAKTMQSLQPDDMRDWVLPLSGGYDSRAVLCFMGESARTAPGFKAVTWGLAESLGDPANDARIASDLAKAMGVEHEYRLTDASGEPADLIVNRFLQCGEGRIDHLAAYADGMRIWRDFHDTGVRGIVRGDEAFGSEEVSSELTLKMHISFATCADYANLDHVIDAFDLPPQEVPAELARGAGESLEAWRDRLFVQYRLPTGFAALSDVKNAYVESINPLLSKGILDVVRVLPDDLRTEKRLFRQVVRDVSPAIPFASRRAIAFSEDILKTPAFVAFMRAELQSDRARQALGSALIDFVLAGLEERGALNDSARRRLAILRRVKSRLPRAAKNWFRDRAIRPRVDPYVLAFRVVMIHRMRDLLASRARVAH